MDIYEIEKMRRARQLALATINRAKEAKIPSDCLRIKEEEFLGFLNPEFYGGKDEMKKITNFIYNDPSFLLGRKFISIDGGDHVVRSKAGYALLFRMIAYDKSGVYYGCSELIHKFQSFDTTNGLSRNDLAEQLKEYDVLFIGEFSRTIFKPYFESAEFIDEVLEHRINFNKPTIISCRAPIEKKTLEERAANGELVSDCGRYLASFAIAHETTNEILRIRVEMKK